MKATRLKLSQPSHAGSYVKESNESIPVRKTSQNGTHA